MPMLVEFEPPTVRVPPILLHSAGAAEVGFGSYGSDRSMSGLARGADLRNFPVQGRKSQPVEQKSCALSAFVMLGRRAVNRLRWSA